MNATIKSCSTGGVDVFLGDTHWIWCASYDEAATECNKKGYRVYG